ncbi:RNA methyltransferase PUA domain-containing protein [Eubacterium sp.]|uniref:RNA methyltransferase PUA domain-containing protein n=1 Tax=Eubacterium sp. TaxID=142586 RepID=UPI0040274517
MQRLFLDEISGNEVILDSEQSRHIAKSLRMRVGDMLMLCDGEDNDYGRIIEEITKDSVRPKIS